eukprot:1459831-Lingulodinium_polyedra.AAC.1
MQDLRSRAAACGGNLQDVPDRAARLPFQAGARRHRCPCPGRAQCRAVEHHLCHGFLGHGHGV